MAEFSNGIEIRNPQKRYAEDVYASLPEVEAGLDLARVHPTLLSGPKEAKVHMSVSERLGREGWNPDQITGARKGTLLHHRNGEVFEVTSIDNGARRLGIKNTDANDMEGAILAAPRVLKAKEYDYRLNGQNRNSKKIKVIDTVFKNRDTRTVEFINTILKAIPAQCMQVFDEIQIHTQSIKDGSFRVEPSLTSRKGVINLYIDQNLEFSDAEIYPTQEVIETLYHELGHAIVNYLKGTTHPGKAWKKCMDESNNDVSAYAAKTRYNKRQKNDDQDRGEIEDIAESFRLYFATDGAKTTRTQPLREFCSPRFEKLDEVMEDLSSMQRKGAITKLFTRSSDALKKAA
jgi:hypothetical protein